MIKIYSKPGCQPCQASKKWLDERNVEYEEVNVKTREGAAEFRKHKLKHIPLILTGHSDGEGKQIAFRHFDHRLFDYLWGGQNGTSTND